MRRVYTESLMSIGGVMLVLIALMMFDGRVRDRATALRSARHATAELSTASEQAREMAIIVLHIARDQSIEHAPLLVFSLAAIILVLFMLRT